MLLKFLFTSDQISPACYGRDLDQKCRWSLYQSPSGVQLWQWYQHTTHHTTPHYLTSWQYKTSNIQSSVKNSNIKSFLLLLIFSVWLSLLTIWILFQHIKSALPQTQIRFVPKEIDLGINILFVIIWDKSRSIFISK